MCRREVEELEALDRWLERPRTDDKPTSRSRRGRAKKISAAVLVSLLESLADELHGSWDDASCFVDL